MEIEIDNTIYFFIVLNMIIAFISIRLIAEDYSENTLLRDYPTFTFLGMVLSILFIAVPMLLYWSIESFIGSVDILGNYIRTKTIIIWIISSVIIFVFLLFIGLLEFKATTKKGIRVFIGILGFSISAAICDGAFLTYYSNYLLDFSKGEEKVVNITNSVHWKSTGKYSSNYYQLSISPAIGTDKLNVSMFLQDEAKKGDKLKIYIKNGLCGIRYVSLIKELIKAETPTK